MKPRRAKAPKRKPKARKPPRREPSLAKLQAQLELRTRERDEALEQQVATAEVLKVISRSTFNLKSVLETLVQSAAILCDADAGIIRQRQADNYLVAATFGLTAEQREHFEHYSPKPDRGSVFGRAVQEGRTIHVPDVLADPEHNRPGQQHFASVRALLGVPLKREGAVVGVFTLYRQEPRPFTQKQIELVTTFAAQAVIAIENARLLHELRQRTGDLTEALEQQTATSEVLKVISSSPGELAPVFESMLENACRICRADAGNLFLCESGGLRAVAVHGETQYTETWRNRPLVALEDGEDLPINRIVRTKTLVHVADMRTEPGYAAGHPRVVALVDAAGARTLLNVPLLRDNKLVGVFGIFRQQVRPFTDKQIELVQNFAAQAVIAIENTRLLSELRQRTDDLTESLEQQTATSEVLQVISSSPGELEPVFQAMLEKASRVCEAKFGMLFLSEGNGFRTVAHHGAPQAFIEARPRDHLVHTDPGTALGRVAVTKQAVQIADILSEPAYKNDPRRSELLELAGARTMLNVPMLKNNELVGQIAIYRQEVRPFSDKQIELVSNFAAQAVIAIENTRLLNELRQRTGDLSESLEQQTATSEVLKVISSSPGELEPVFETMLVNAVGICGAKFGALSLREGDAFRSVVMHGAPPAFAEERRRQPLMRPAPGHNLERLVRTRNVVHIPDLSMDREAAPAPFEFAGARSLLNVPLLKDNELIGSILIYRQETGPFGDKQIELVKNFAAQAVIAIENTRLLNELRQRTGDLSEALEQQTATSEVLQAISSSPGELEPVFKAMLANATRICEAKFGTMFRYDGNLATRVASVGTPATLLEFQEQRGPFKPDPHNNFAHCLQNKTVVHAADELAEPKPGVAAVHGGARSTVHVPMLKDNEPIGIIVIYRQEVRPFTDKQIELVKNFASQAVIAIENTRLLNELRQSLQQQTATADVLKTISRSTFDLQTVLDTLVELAARLCNADRAAIRVAKEGLYHNVASCGYAPDQIEWLKRNPYQPDRSSVVGRVMLDGKSVHIGDTLTDPEYMVTSRSEVLKVRSLLGVPLLREGATIGALILMRNVAQPFTDQQIALVTTFADQAVIAMENVRLFDDVQKRTDELSESLQQQTATADVLKTISRSTFDLQTVLDTLVESAGRLCRAEQVSIRLVREDAYHYVASYGLTPAIIEFMRGHPLSPDRFSMVGRVALESKAVHVLDMKADPDLATLAQGSIRTAVGVPLLREGKPVGVLLVMRSIVEPFTDKQIELATTFADQAVIAIENVRLFDEVQKRTNDLSESLQQQTATAEVLKVISRSTFDLPTVLKTLVQSVAWLCGADKAQILRPTANSTSTYSAASYGHTPEFDEHMKTLTFGPGRAGVVGRVLLENKTVQIPDVLADAEYGLHETQRLGGYRTHLGVPLMREGRPIGLIVLSRMEVRPFDDKQIELATTFADQAVIAIENVRLFDEIQDKSHQLAEASKHKSQFLANMSHELRTPLNAILGYTELVLDGVYGEAPEKALAVLKRVETNGKHLLGLINDVLDLSKIEAGELKLSLTDYSMKDVVYGVFSAVEPLATRKKLDFKVELPPDMPAGQGDERRLTQVLLNLVGNAIKFTDAGEVAIRVAATDGSFSVAVHDTGPGISPADQTKLFQEFQQADSSITKAKGGTGLGLAISRRIIELHGGRIWVDSSPGDGSTFTFTLPIVVEQQAGPS